MRLTVRPGTWPAVIGAGLVAASIAVASTVAALTGGQAPAAGAAHHGAAYRGAAASAPNPAGLTGSDYRVAPLSLPGPSGGSAAPPKAPRRQPAPAASASPSAASAAGSAVPRLIVPDVIAAVPGGVTRADLARISKLSQVRAVLPIAGARITVNGKPLTVLGAPAAALRPWLPPAIPSSAWPPNVIEVRTAAATG